MTAFVKLYILIFSTIDESASVFVMFSDAQPDEFLGKYSSIHIILKSFHLVSALTYIYPHC